MTAPVIDLAAIRQNRDAAIQLGRSMAQAISEGIVARIVTWAERAHAGSCPLMATDPEMARGINRWALRRLKAEVRRSLDREMPDAARQDVLASVEDGFFSALVALSARDRTVGEAS